MAQQVLIGIASPHLTPANVDIHVFGARDRNDGNNRRRQVVARPVAWSPHPPHAEAKDDCSYINSLKIYPPRVPLINIKPKDPP